MMGMVVEVLRLEGTTGDERATYHVHYCALGRGLCGGGDDLGMAMAEVCN